MSLQEIRKEIDIIDNQIVQLLSARLKLAMKSKAYKKKIEDKAREEDILAKLEKMAEEYGLDFNYLMKVYKIIFTEGKRRQNQ